MKSEPGMYVYIFECTIQSTSDSGSVTRWLTESNVTFRFCFLQSSGKERAMIPACMETWRTNTDALVCIYDIISNVVEDQKDQTRRYRKH